VPNAFPIRKFRGQSARGGRIWRVASGLTVTTTVESPRSSISRCTATTVRWQTWGQPPLRTTTSAPDSRSISSAMAGAVSSYIFRSCVV